MGRTLFVVARPHADLYEYLRERFAADSAVEVILDRRQAQRRHAQIRFDTERRRTDRRCHPEVDVELRVRSHAILTMS